MECSPPGCSVHGILQARILEWVAVRSSSRSPHSVQSLSRVGIFATPWTATRQVSLSITNSGSVLKLLSIQSVMPFGSRPLSSPSPPAFNLSQHQGLASMYLSPKYNTEYFNWFDWKVDVILKIISLADKWKAHIYR